MDYVIDRVLKNIPEARLNGGRIPRLPGNANISFPGLEGETILLDLDMHGICASTGSACNSDSLDPSHVLLSIGVPEEIGHGSMRFTFGPQNTMEEAKYLCDVLEEVIPPPSCYELYVAAGPEHGPSLQPEGRAVIMASMYSAKVMEHFANPHNVGEIPDANGVGEVGNPKCAATLCACT